MNTVILNREFQLPANHSYHIVPHGEYPVRADDGEEIVQVIDGAAVKKISEDFANTASQPNFPGLLVDYDHFSHDQNKESRAAGWLTTLWSDSDGIVGKIRFSNSGQAAVEGGDYRFLSPVFDRASAEPLGGKRFRVTKLVRLAVTNDPNMKGMVPLSNRTDAGLPKNLPHDAANRPAAEQADTQKRKSMKSIATRLGLSADASEEAILGELTKLENRATAAEGKLTPLEAENKTLKNRVETIEDEQAEADLDHAGIAADDPDRKSIKELLLKNREGGLALLKKFGGKTAEPKTQLTNRASAKTPGKGAADGGEAAEKQKEQKRAVLIRNRAEGKMRESKALSITSAFHQAILEIDQELAAGIIK